MARAKKSVCWTICYAVKDDTEDCGFYTATWFAYGKTAEEAKQNYLKEKAYEEKYCGGDSVENISVLNVFKGFSC